MVTLAIVLLGLLVSLPSEAGFDTAVNYPVGAYALSVAVGDFNGDGNQDLAVAAFSYTDGVSILLGTGNGSFGPTAHYAAGTYSSSVAVGDFDRDGKQDLAVANYGSDLSILRGNGDGSFQPPVDYWAGGNTRSVVVGDFNRDGRQDLAVASESDHLVWILLATASGTFLPAGYLSGGSWSLALGDFDADGNQDLAGATYNTSAVILLGTGSGGFQLPVAYSTDGWLTFALAVGDFDGDGKQDLVVSNEGSSDISILRGIGDGTFEPPVNYLAGSRPHGVAVGDFEANGRQDLAVANALTGAVSILRGSGNGAFEPAGTYGVGSYPRAVAVGDFDRNGKQDLVVANEFSSDVSVLLNNSRDTRTALSSSINPSGLGELVTLTASVSSDIGTPAGTVVFRDGTMELGSGTLNAGGTATFVTSALFAGGHSITAAYQGDDNFAGSTSARLIQVVSVLPGDFGGDGKTDILFRHQTSGKNVVWHMDGITRTSGLFTSPATLSDTNWQTVGTNDFNGDHGTDVLFRHAVSGKNMVWLMDGITRTGGVFTNPDTLHDTNWQVVATGDLSSPPDGRPDLLFRHAMSGKNVVWLMDGITRTAGVFMNPPVLADTQWQIAGVGDFSGPRDGKADIVWRHAASRRIAVWLMDGITRTLGVFTNPDSLSDTNWSLAAVGDYSSPPDGKPDILWRHQVSGKIVAWFMDGVTRTAGVLTNPAQLADTNWRIVGPK